MDWKPDNFKINTSTGVDTVQGQICNGLGLHKKGRVWRVTHLNSGLIVRDLGPIGKTKALELATELAELTDWDFIGEEGWKNRDPALPDKMWDWHQKHGLAAKKITKPPAGSIRNHNARQIAEERA